MPVRNQNWYNLQSTRRYPLDDKSTGLSDTGELIREDIVVDCHLRFPETIGKYAYVQGLTVTENLITIVFGAAETLTSENNPTIAVASVAKPTAINVSHDITPMMSGVSGWITFGPGIETNFVGRYSTPIQTYVDLRNARAYRPLPIPTLGKVDLNTALSGLVLLTATSPVVASYVDENFVVPEERLPKYDPQTQTTNYEPIKAIIFSTDAPTAAFNPLQEFLGPCGQRPESGTCPKKPIERINGVAPDCENGNINIVATSGLTIRPFAECGGADITTPLGLTEACRQDPKSERKRKDECPCDTNDNDNIENYCWPPFDPNRAAVCFDPGEPAPPLPICTSFSPCHEALFEIVSGSFSPREANAPPVCCPVGSGFSDHDIYAAQSLGTMNIALLRGSASDWAFNHTISVEVQPRGGGSRQNGGVIANYLRVTENGRCKTKYIAALVDVSGNELQIYRYNGAVLIKENALAIVADPTHWYRVSVIATAAGTSTTINATLYDITAAVQIGSLSTTILDYEAINGRFGLIANASGAYFNKFEVV